MGVLLLLCALMSDYIAVLKIDYQRTRLPDLGPHDATEYFAQARALLEDGWPSIQIGYDKLPSRYALSYPAMVLPWLVDFRNDSRMARRRCSIVVRSERCG